VTALKRTSTDPRIRFVRKPELIIPFTVDRDPSEPVARFSIQTTSSFFASTNGVLVPLTFKFISGLKSITGSAASI